jgi:hypothetical protein
VSCGGRRMRGQSIASLRTFSQAKPRDMVSLLNFVHYSTQANRFSWWCAGGSGKMLLKCTAAAITLYLHLYSNKLTGDDDGPDECSPNIHYFSLLRSQIYINEIFTHNTLVYEMCVFACDSRRARRRFSVEFRALFRTGGTKSSDSHHRAFCGGGERGSGSFKLIFDRDPC